MKDKILSIMACVAIAILLVSNLSTMVMAESDPARDIDLDPGSLDGVNESDLIIDTVLGTGSAVVGGVIGVFVYMKAYYTIWETHHYIFNAISPSGIRALSAGGALLSGLATTAALFGIGYGIYQAVSG